LRWRTPGSRSQPRRATERLSPSIPISATHISTWRGFCSTRAMSEERSGTGAHTVGRSAQSDDRSGYAAAVTTPGAAWSPEALVAASPADPGQWLLRVVHMAWLRRQPRARLGRSRLRLLLLLLLHPQKIGMFRHIGPSRAPLLWCPEDAAGVAVAWRGGPLLVIRRMLGVLLGSGDVMRCRSRWPWPRRSGACRTVLARGRAFSDSRLGRRVCRLREGRPSRQ
jgi:hypothetical protein